MKNGVSWDVTQCGSYKNPDVTMMMEALRSSETSVLTRATRSNIPEDAILLTSEDSTDLVTRFSSHQLEACTLPSDREGHSAQPDSGYMQ
jgi:hypothetical protein